MPYTNMPKDPALQAKMEKCVVDVVKTGKAKKNAIAICHASLMGKGEKKKDDESEFILDPTLLDPALLVAGMDVEEYEEAKEVKELGALQAWLKEQFDGVRESLGLNKVKPKKKCPTCDEEMDDEATHVCASSKKELREGSLVYKDRDTGAYRWLAVFTNKFRDRDNPPEILSDAAHRDFVKAVNAGEWPMPEYRLWHITAPVGRADYLAYHDAGFVVAAGTFTKGLEPVAEMMEHSSFRWINSHGMPVGEIRREDEDKTIITRYRSKEITALPEWAAANELTFNFIGGDEMAGFNDKDRERLTQMFGDKAVEVEKLLVDVGQKAVETGVESKEKDETPVAPAEEETSTPYPTRDEVADVLRPLAEAVNQLTASLVELQTGMKELREQTERKDRAALAATPTASLAEMVMASVTQGKPDEARLKGRDASMSGSKETPVPAKPEARTGFRRIPFLAEMTETSGAETPQEN